MTDKPNTPNSEAKILVVDDLPSARRVMRRMLERGGFSKVSEAKDGAEALQFIGLNQCDLVISDWHMPQVSGIDLLSELNNKFKERKIPFLLVTSENRREEVIQALKAGVVDYICKPFSFEILINKVQSVMSNQKK